jgi:Ca2+-binding EF-hand superfamily protein
LFALTTCIPTYAQDNYSDEQQSYSDEQQSNQQTSQRQSNQQRSDARRTIERYDENDDGMLQRVELPQDMRSSFSRLDRDKSGDLSASELREHGRRMQRSIVPVEVVCVWVSDVDQNPLSIKDLQSAYDTLQDLDENSDGQISRNELQQRRHQIASRWAKQVVNRLDQDDDGMVNEDEAQDSFLARQFDQVDNDSDGSISRQELQRSVASNRQGEQQETRAARRSQDQTR